MDGFDRDAAIKRRTAEDLFRHKTTIVAELFHPETQASNDFDKNGPDFPKLSRRRPASGTGNAWKQNNPAVRQLSSLGKQTPVPKYYPLGLWQHQRQGDLPRVQKIGLMSSPRKSEPDRTKASKQEKDSKVFGGAKEALPPLHITRAPSYQYRQHAKPSLLKTSVTNGFHDEPGSRGETPSSASESSIDHVAPWERSGYTSFQKKTTAKKQEFQNHASNVLSCDTFELSEGTATLDGQTANDPHIGEKQRYFAVSESDFDVPIPNTSNAIGDKDNTEYVGEDVTEHKEITNTEAETAETLELKSEIEDHVKENLTESPRGDESEHSVEMTETHADAESVPPKKKPPLTRRRVVHFGETDTTAEPKEDSMEQERNEDDEQLDSHSELTQDEAHPTPDPETLEAMKIFAKQIVSGAIQAAFLEYQSIKSQSKVNYCIAEDSDSEQVTPRETPKPAPLDDSPDSPKDSVTSSSVHADVCVEKDTTCGIEDDVHNLKTCPPPTTRINVCFIIGPGMAEETTNILRETVPRCRTNLAQQGFQMNLTCFNMDDLETMDPAIRMQVIRGYVDECRRYGVGPFYYVLLGQKYGNYDPPLEIPTSQYKLFKEFWQSGLSVDLQLLTEWYQESGPDKFTLKPVQSMVEDHSLFLSDNQTMAAWHDVRSRLCEAIASLTGQASSQEYIDADTEVHLTSATDATLRYIFDMDSDDLTKTFLKTSSCLCLELSVDDLDLENEDILNKIDSTTTGEKHCLDTTKQEKLTDIKRIVSKNMGYRSIKTDTTESHKEVEKSRFEKDADQHTEAFFKEIVDQTIRINTHVADTSSLPYRMHAERWSHDHAIEACQAITIPEHLQTKMKETLLDPNKNHPLIITSANRQKLSPTVLRLQTLAKEWITPIPEVVTRRMGVTRMSNNLDEMLLNLCQDICARYEVDYTTPEMNSVAHLSKSFLEILHKISVEYGPEKPLVVLLDSLDLAAMRDNSHLACTWLPENLPDNVYIIVTIPVGEKTLIENLQKRIKVSDYYINLDDISEDSNELDISNTISKLETMFCTDNDLLRDILSLLALYSFGLSQDALISALEQGWNDLRPGRLGFSVHCIKMMLADWMETVYDTGVLVHKMNKIFADAIIEKYKPGLELHNAMVNSLLGDFDVCNGKLESCSNSLENTMYVFIHALSMMDSEDRVKILKQTWVNFDWLSRILSASSPREICNATRYMAISTEALGILYEMIYQFVGNTLPPMTQLASDLLSSTSANVTDPLVEHLIATTKKWINDSELPALVPRTVTKHQARYDRLPIDGPTDVIRMQSEDTLVTWGVRYGIQVWDTEHSKLRHHLYMPQNTKDDVVVNASGEFVYHTDNTMLYAWSSLTGRLEGVLDLLPNVSNTGRVYNPQRDPMPFLTTGAVNKDGSLLAVRINFEEMLTDRKGIVIVDAKEMSVKTVIGKNLYGAAVREMTFTDDDQYLLVTCAGPMNQIVVLKINPEDETEKLQKMAEKISISETEQVIEHAEHQSGENTENVRENGDRTGEHGVDLQPTVPRNEIVMGHSEAPSATDSLEVIEEKEVLEGDVESNMNEAEEKANEPELQNQLVGVGSDMNKAETNGTEPQNQADDGESNMKEEEEEVNESEDTENSKDPQVSDPHLNAKTVQLPNLGSSNELSIFLGRAIPLSGVWKDRTLIIGCQSDIIMALNIENKCFKSSPLPLALGSVHPDDSMKVFVMNNGNIASVYWRLESSSPVVLKTWSQDLKKLSEICIDYNTVLRSVVQTENVDILALAYSDKIVFVDVQMHVCTHVVDGLSNNQWIHTHGDVLLIGSGTDHCSIRKRRISDHTVPTPYDKNLDVDDLDTDRSTAETIHVISVPPEPRPAMSSAGETLGVTHMVAAGDGLVTIVGDHVKFMKQHEPQENTSTNVETLQKHIIDLTVMENTLVGLATSEDDNQTIIMHWDLSALDSAPLLYNINLPTSSKRHRHLLSNLSTTDANETELQIIDLHKPEDEIRRYTMPGVDVSSTYSISQDGRYCVLPGDDCLSVWRLSSEDQCEHKEIPIPSTPQTYTLRKGDLMVGTAQGSVHIFKLDDLWDQSEDNIPVEHIRNVVPNTLQSLSLTSDEDTVVVGDSGNGLTLMAATEPENYQTLPVDRAKIDAWTMSKDGSLFVSANARGDLRLWGMRTRSILATTCTRCAVAALALLQGDRVLAVWLGKADRQTSRLVFYDLANIPNRGEQDHTNGA